jgi:hypothetical protein
MERNSRGKAAHYNNPTFKLLEEMKKYLVEYILTGSTEIKTYTIYAKNIDGAYSAATKDMQLPHILLTIIQL